MKFYLIERYNPVLNLGNNHNIIALTPEASYELDRAGLDYTTLEDYCDGSDLLKDEEAYFNNQLIWFDRFDKLLIENLPEAKAKDLKLATSYYFWIKCMLDSVILRCKDMHTFIDKVKPHSIIYVSRDKAEDGIDCEFPPIIFGKGQTIFSHIIPLFCSDRGIDLHRVIADRNPGVDGENKRQKGLKRMIKDRISRYKYIRDLKNLKNTFTMIQLKSKRNGLKTLFLNIDGYNIKYIVREALRRGCTIFYKTNNKIVRKHFLYNKPVEDFDFILPVKISDSLFKDNREYEALLNWINNYCGVNASSIIKPRLDYFIRTICPQFIALIDTYIEFYNKNDIDLVFTPYTVTVDEHAAIAATRYSNRTKSVCLQHGNDVFLSKMLDISEYMPYHIYCTTDDEKEEYVRERVRCGGLKTQVVQYPDRFKALPKKFARQRKVKIRNAHRQTIIYVPLVMGHIGDTTFWNEGIISTMLYFNMHKKLIKLFGSRDDFNFIWKSLTLSNGLYDSIHAIIRESGYTNIRYDTGSLQKWLKRADRVILDFPSTALYETAVNGLPVISLYCSSLSIIRESAQRIFGHSLQSFDTCDDGISKIDRFLNSDPNDFVVSIPRSRRSIFDQIESLAVLDNTEAI